MGRDLLYKPPTPLIITEEDKPEVKIGPQKADKLGTKLPSREVGRVEDPILQKLLQKTVPGAAAAEQGGAAARADGKPEAAPAFKSAYFNQDMNSVRDVNQRGRNMQALRGAEGVTDLRRVVLPKSFLVDTPSPAHLHESLQSMGMGNGFEQGLEDLLGRLGQWAHHKDNTIEKIEERLAQLEEMVAIRIAALRRMQSGVNHEQLAGHATLRTAANSSGNNVEQATDLSGQGRELIRETAEHAKGMRKHIAKALGIKL